MNISKNKIQIISILILVSLIAILSLFKKEITPFADKNVKDISRIKEIYKNDNPVMSYIVEKNIAGYDNKKNDLVYEPVNIPQIVNTSNNKVWGKVNQSILDNFENNKCAYTGDSLTKSDIYYNWGATTTLINNHVLSLNVSVDSYCGGAHPNVVMYGLNFNLDKWTEGKNSQINFSDIFKDYSKDRLKIKDIVLFEVMKDYDANTAAECKEEIWSSYKNSLESYKEDSSVEPFSYSFDDKGLYVLSFGLAHAVASCEPSSTLISYTKLKDYIHPEFLEILK